MKIRAAVIASVVVLAGVVLSASGPLGIYAIVDKVVLEPNEQSPERIQIWGAFAYVDGAAGGTSISTARRGYLYFRISEISPQLSLVRKEWADLKAVAGTGQAVGFGRWLYIGSFDGTQPDRQSQFGIYAPAGGERVDLTVRSETTPPANPTWYLTNTGVVKINETSHAAVVKALREAPKP